MAVAIKDIVPSAERKVNTQFIVLAKQRWTTDSRGRRCLALVADETAAVHLEFWGDDCDAFQPGDIVRLTNGIFSPVRPKELVLRAGKNGKVKKVGEFTMAYTETPNISEIDWGPDLANPRMVSVLSPYSRLFPPLS